MEDISTLSGINSRAEHIAYLTEELGLDRPTAAMFHRGERLQEKGQLQQAAYYFMRVLENYPECSEASENIRIVKSLLDDVEETKSIPVFPEKKSPHSLPVNVTEMEVKWYGRVDHLTEYFPYADKCAIDEAERRLREIGYGNSLLEMQVNKITHKISDPETGWVTYLEGKALFQVRLIPATDWDEGLELHTAVLHQSISQLTDSMMEQNVDPIQSVVQPIQDLVSPDLHQNSGEEADIDPTQHLIQRNNNDLRGTNSMGFDINESEAWAFMDAEEEVVNLVPGFWRFCQ